MKKEKGFTFIEVVISLAVLGIIAVGFLSGLTAASKGLMIADERATAHNLAESLMENVKNQPYATSYSVSVPGEYAGYIPHVVTLSLEDGNIQKITITIDHQDKPGIIVLEDYKVY